MSHDQQAQRLREIDDLLAECQRHDMTGVRVSYAQLRALRDAMASGEAAGQLYAALDYVIRDLEIRAGTSGVVELGHGAYMQAKRALEMHHGKH